MTDATADRRKSLPADVLYHRARVGGLVRDRAPDDPELLEARASLIAARQRQAARQVLDGVAARNNGGDMTEALRGGDDTLKLLEAVEILAYLVRLSDRPEQMLDALLERVNTAT